MPEPRALALSICIATFRRADFIAETLASIAAQLEDGMEVVIVDGASPDATEAAVAPFVARYPAFRFIREPINSGVDADYDKAVGYARGDHVWLMTDDDLLLPGAVAAVLAAIADAPDLVVVDAVVKDARLERVIEARRLGFSGIRTYGPGDSDALLADVGNAMSFIGGTIFRRAFWMERDRRAFYGSLFIHVGVAFQAPHPAHAVAIGSPLIAIRFGNAMWSARALEIWMLMWPRLIWSLPGYSDAAKAAVCAREPWRDWRLAVIQRASGALSLAEWRRWFAKVPLAPRLRLLAIALVPGRSLNTLTVRYLARRRGTWTPDLYTLVHASRFSGPRSRAIAADLTSAAS